MDPFSGYKVFTEYAHLQRGKCCGSACRHVSSFVFFSFFCCCHQVVSSFGSLVFFCKFVSFIQPQLFCSVVFFVSIVFLLFLVCCTFWFTGNITDERKHVIGNELIVKRIVVCSFVASTGASKQMRISSEMLFISII